MMRRSPMKRTGFSRKTDGPRHIAEILAEKVLPRLYRIPALSAAPVFEPAVKLNPLRSEAYRRFVASFPCFGCGLALSSQCAHANKGKGMAMKVCDRRTFPLCFPCHSDLDNTRGMTRDQRRELEAEYVERMQAIAREHRRPEFAESN